MSFRVLSQETGGVLPCSSILQVPDKEDNDVVEDDDSEDDDSEDDDSKS